MRTVVTLVIVLAVAALLWMFRDDIAPAVTVAPGTGNPSAQAPERQVERVAEAVADAVSRVVEQSGSGVTPAVAGTADTEATPSADLRASPAGVANGGASAIPAPAAGGAQSNGPVSQTQASARALAPGADPGQSASTNAMAQGSAIGADSGAGRATASTITSGVADLLAAAPAPPDVTRPPTVATPTVRPAAEIARAISKAVSDAVAKVGAGAAPAAVAGEVAKEVARAVAGPELTAHPQAVGAAVAAAVERTLPDTDTADLAQTVTAAVLEEQAENYVRGLSAPRTAPIDPAHADHFVTQAQVVSLLPEASIETMSAAELFGDSDLPSDTPITVVRTVDQIEIATPERLIAEAAGDLDHPVRIVENEVVRELSVRALLRRFEAEPRARVQRLRSVRYFEITTPGELAASATVKPGETLRIIREPYRLEAASIADLLRREMELSPDSIFYVRTVRPEDDHGIWGIILDGIVGNFARGMAIRHGQEQSTYQIDIPRDADEIQTDRTSSFLGRLIHDKTFATHIYNFRENRMGRNADRIIPGQEIIIVNFKPEELISIYKHFHDRRG